MIRERLDDGTELVLRPIAPAALVAVVDGRIVGVARYVTIEDGVAEVAFVVADPLQRHGIGTHLRDALLALAAKNGIHTIRANVLSYNRPMRRLLDTPTLERLGEHDGVIELRLRAPVEPSEWTGLPLRGP